MLWTQGDHRTGPRNALQHLGCHFPRIDPTGVRYQSGSPGRNVPWRGGTPARNGGGNLFRLVRIERAGYSRRASRPVPDGSNHLGDSSTESTCQKSMAIRYQTNSASTSGTSALLGHRSPEPQRDQLLRPRTISLGEGRVKVRTPLHGARVSESVVCRSSGNGQNCRPIRRRPPLHQFLSETPRASAAAPKHLVTGYSTW